MNVHNYNNDPFFQIETTVVQLFNQINLNDPKQLKQSKQFIVSVNRMLNELSNAITQIEQNRVKFSHITDDELKRRKDFLFHYKNQMQEIKEKIIRSNNIDHSHNVQSDDDDEYKQSQLAIQLNLRKTQNQYIDQLDTGVDHLISHAKTIKQELDGQHRLLNDLEDDINDSENNLTTVMTSLNKLLKESKKSHIWLIVVLIAILVGILMLIIFL